MVESSHMLRAIFLDRDGVINKKPNEHDYVKSWSEFELLPDVSSAIKLAKDKGFVVIVVTNQRGIARGLLDNNVLVQIHENLNKLLLRNNTYIDAFYFCPHNIETDCECRKPKPGMILKAALDFGIDINKSLFIGDTETDRKTGINAGLKTIIIPTDTSFLAVLKEYLNE